MTRSRLHVLLSVFDSLTMSLSCDHVFQHQIKRREKIILWMALHLAQSLSPNTSSTWPFLLYDPYLPLPIISLTTPAPQPKVKFSILLCHIPRTPFAHPPFLLTMGKTTQATTRTKLSAPRPLPSKTGLKHRMLMHPLMSGTMLSITDRCADIYRSSTR